MRRAGTVAPGSFAGLRVLVPSIVGAVALASCGGARPLPGAEADESIVSDLSSPACASHGVQIVDLQADFRDIWAGLETPQTGKQSDPAGPVVVDWLFHPDEMAKPGFDPGEFNSGV